MAAEAKEYYGIEDGQILSLGISEDDAKFILSQFDGERHRYESWGSIHEDEAANQVVSTQLVDNMRAKQQELLDDLLRGLFGKNPPQNARARHLKVRVPSQQSCIRWLVWRNRPIVCATSPITYTNRNRIFLRWYWRPTEDAISRIRG